jgi:hypothetical protein
MSEHAQMCKEGKNEQRFILACTLNQYLESVKGSTDCFVQQMLFSELSRLDKIWGFQGSDYEEWRLLGCGAV